MTPTITACPKCRQPIAPGAKFCASCGNDISGVWSTDPALGGTIAVEVDPNVDTLGQMLSEATLGDYDIYGELGRGGMAAVYLGLDLALNRKVAIKTMLPELIARGDMVSRFKREAQTSAALNHPHIIQIYTVRETKQLVYFVMKFIEGRSLESVITDKGQVPLPMVQTILGQVGSALDYAHRKHVVHRDIKPANIMIDEDGWAIVTDFGIAKVQEAQNLTATGTAIGTPHYMSPEQFHNKAVTGQSDQYSLGIVLYEMLAGKKPFDGATYAEIITQHLFEAVPDIRTVNADVPPHVVDVINKMLAKEPSERFPDLDTAIHALGTHATKKDGDVVRTQMISLAKSGPQKKVRMSVPMSPIPVTKKKAAPAATAIEPKAQVKKAGSSKWLVAAVITLAVLGAGGFAALKFLKPATLSTASLPTEQTPAATPAAPTTDRAGTANTAGSETKTAAAPAAAAISSDSMMALVEARMAAKARQDSIRKAREEARRVADQPKTKAAVTTAATTTKTAEAPPVQQQAQVTAPPAAPAPPATATIKIGSPTPNAFLYVNGGIENAISAVRTVTIPAGAPVSISVRAANCTPWDTTITPAPGANVVIGRRFAKCP
jgi:serine/threonine protein kinase